MTTEKTEYMDHEEWIRFVWLNRPSLIEQLRSMLPDDIEFTNIDPGLRPIIYLKRPHGDGDLELGFLAVKTTLDDEGNIQEADILYPSAESEPRPKP